MGARRNEAIGFLKSEFLDSLRKLPDWRRTRYFCLASALLDVSSGRVVDEQRLAQKRPRRGECGVDAADLSAMKPGAFRLTRYQINRAPNGSLSWTCCGGTDRMTGGPAIIESDILFLCPGQTGGAPESKKEFLSTLNSLPQWEGTPMWCRSLALKTVPERTGPAPRPRIEKNDGLLQRELASAARHYGGHAKGFWSQMARCYDTCVAKIRARRPQRTLARIGRKLRKKRIGQSD